MSVTRWVERAQAALVVAWMFGLGYAIGFPQVQASCTDPECKEVYWAAAFENLASAPAERKVTSNERFDHKQAFTLYATGPLGGTPTKHDTAKTMKRTGCNPYNRMCPAQLKNGTYEVSRHDDPTKETGITGCSAKAQADRTFCANDEGEGVTDSWHKGKKKDEAPAE